jgi:hypothetical protein
MCDQAIETIDHLLVHCIFAREYWYQFLSQVGLQSLSPLSTQVSFYDWWERVSNGASGLVLQGLNSLISSGPRHHGLNEIGMFLMEVHLIWLTL